MRVINSGLTIVLAVCFGIACPAALAAGVDAKSMVDAKVKCALPAVLAQALREHARQEIENLKDEFESMKKWAGPERPPSYRWCAVDLNDDGRPEVIYHSGICGMGGCASQVLAWRRAKLAPVGKLGISHEGPMIGKRRHRGWQDLYLWQKGSASSFSILVYTFREGAYRDVKIPLMSVELSDRTVDPDGVTINRDRNEFRIGQNIPEAEREQRLRDELGWSPFDWAGAEPGYRDEPYRTEN
jgi:hypothetical protein